MVETFLVNEGRGLYRWKRDEGWPESDEPNDLCQFEEGDAVTIDPFHDANGNSYGLWPIYCEFCEYVTPEVAKVYVPPAGEDSGRVWFQEGEGEYLIHEGYLTPQ